LLVSSRLIDDAFDAVEVEDDVAVVVIEVLASVLSMARAMISDEMVGDLCVKIERMGVVNMMAIDQFDDLEFRYAFFMA